MKPVLILLSVLLWGSPSYATSPCMAPDAEWFAQNIAKKSDLVVYGRVEDYSGAISQMFDKEWTEIEVIEVLFGVATKGDTLTIRDWQSYMQPLYVFDKGSYGVFWLKEQNGNYYVTDLDWGRCVPSIWGADAEGMAYGLMINKRMTMSEIRSYIVQARQ